jgi:hypothetical protein
VTQIPGPSPLADHSAIPKYHESENWDAGPNAHSSTFIYDFAKFRFRVNPTWREVLAHDADGTGLSGSIETRVEEYSPGCEVKVGICGLCSDLHEGSASIDPEVFVQTGSLLLLHGAQTVHGGVTSRGQSETRDSH